MDEEIKKDNVQPTKRVLLRNDENFWRYLEQRIAELSKAVKQRAQNTDQQITTAGEQIRTQIPDWLKYDMSQHKTREGGFIPGSINRYPVEKRGGKI